MIEQNYQNQNILLTGAASGIGFSQLKTYLSAGAQVWALDQQPIALSHPNLHAIQIDLRNHQQLQSLGAELVAERTFDILLNTAGILDGFQPTLATDWQLWQDVWATNVTPMYLLTNACLPGMLAQQRGHIINMASIAGLIAGGGGAAYTTSKHAIVGYTKQLALDYASQGIHANAIAPGAIETPMNAADFAGTGDMACQVAAQTPARRWAKPQEVADLTLYLTSPQADYLNGVVVPIDGGWSLGH
ncbi:3-oxoacyl-ACP reductase [Convivina intestini]|uniref:3-oxoacyl-ACP reductase n=1 Tax=Convivina intestini TaxID=1505726 RepID=UPI00200F29BA|nr:3-oxoacyl-ACP reductase [Convivina intestini]CAH1851507.1 3-beta-hydroxycholanate 3-dehydrogenase (NAD(+)) 2 [Convivina intestini]